MTDVPARRPGGLARLAGLVAAVAGFLEIFAVGFPPASRERLPVLALSAVVAFAAAWNPGRGLAIFAFLAPVAGLGGRLVGGVDSFAWPLLLFLAMAAGWAFRFLYDFESLPDPSRADFPLRVLVALWAMSAALAVLSARSVWALVRGLQLRAVNVDGLPDAGAIRTSVLSFAVLASGAAFFFLARRAGARDRERALRAAVAGIACSGAVAVTERLGIFGRETRPYWRIAGRYSGAAVDPNALGILCASGTILAAGLAAASSGRRRAAAAIALPVLAAGLALSGSRSGFALAAIGLVGLLFARAIPVRRRAAAVALAAALVAIVAAKYLSEARGSSGARVLELFDARVPLEYRVSTRPVLWQSAITLFSRHPVEGAGLGAFSWQLPNLLAESGRSLGGATDNPGSAYLQALAETGLLGFVLTVAFLGIVAAESWSALRDAASPALASAAGAVVIGFLAALLTGSHWLSPDAAFVFFLAATVALRRPPLPQRRGARALAGLALAAYAVAAAASAAATSRAGEAFRYRSEMGFYAPETGPGGSYRWTRKRFAVRLAPGETDHMALVHFTPEDAAVRLDALADGRPVFQQSLAPGEEVHIRLRAPADAPAVFRFVLSRAFVPRHLGTSRDSRELGVMALAEPGR
ncbi:MAG TPA: O-antigen ligase family protein [Thermoanaerobaculia bacterium]|nr:O-antigen ligase family protein [Thermoanaerobaculia bacterium]